MKSYKQPRNSFIAILMLFCMSAGVKVYAEKFSKPNEEKNQYYLQNGIELEAEALDEDFIDFFIGLGENSQAVDAIDLLDSMVDMDVSSQAVISENDQDPEKKQ